MKIQINSQVLSTALSQVATVIQGRVSIPILGNVKIVATWGDEITLTTNDFEMDYKLTISARVEEPGETTIPAKRLLAALKGRKEEISIETHGASHDWAFLKTQSSVMKFEALPSAEFPPAPKHTESHRETSFYLPQEKLKEHLKKVSYAISTDETRYALNGVRFESENNELSLVGCDGRRLARSVQTIQEGHSIGVTVPTKALKPLDKMLGKEGGVTVKISENQECIRFIANDSTLVVTLIPDNYPNYKQVIPEAGKVTGRVSLNRKEFLESIKRVSSFLSDKSHSLALSIHENEIEVIASSPDLGEFSERVSCTYTGEPMRIAFNPTFLGEPFKAHSCETMFLDMIDNESPGMIKTPDPSFLYVLMPMRVHHAAPKAESVAA